MVFRLPTHQNDFATCTASLEYTYMMYSSRKSCLLELKPSLCPLLRSASSTSPFRHRYTEFSDRVLRCVAFRIQDVKRGLRLVALRTLDEMNSPTVYKVLLSVGILRIMMPSTTRNYTVFPQSFHDISGAERKDRVPLLFEILDPPCIGTYCSQRLRTDSVSIASIIHP